MATRSPFKRRSMRLAVSRRLAQEITRASAEAPPKRVAAQARSWPCSMKKHRTRPTISSRGRIKIEHHVALLLALHQFGSFNLALVPLSAAHARRCFE